VLALEEFYLSIVCDQVKYMRLERHHLEGHWNQDHNNQPCQEIRIGSHFEMTESIGNYNFRSFYIFHCWSKFFYDEMPSHDVFSIEVFVSKVLMVCVDHTLLT
jgi:hypothetical protein